MPEELYIRSAFAVSELPHAWGPNVHLLDDPMALTYLARLSSPQTVQPELTRILRRLYEYLTWVVLNAEFPRKIVDSPTRMIESTKAGSYHGGVIDKTHPVVTVGIARAGTVPSQIVYEILNEVMDPSKVRQDHLVMSRLTNAQGEVIGTSFDGAKTGDEVDGATVLIPDPMGATGSTVVEAIAYYKERMKGTAASIATMHLVVTPEYLRRVRKEHPDVKTYALRYDRGLSPDRVFSTPPGADAEERGLNELQYIVPGAGGLGELLNNAF